MTKVVPKQNQSVTELNLKSREAVGCFALVSFYNTAVNADYIVFKQEDSVAGLNPKIKGPRLPFVGLP